MIRYTSIENLRLIGGHPVLDFANTVVARRDRYGPDLLKSYDDLLDWAIRAGALEERAAKVLAKVSKATPADALCAFERAKSLREAIYAVFSALCGDAPVPDKPLLTLEKAAKQARSRSQLIRFEDGFAWRPRHESDLNLPWHLVAASAADLLVQNERRMRIRECHGQNCGWLFLDTSKSGRRKWCSEEDCGSAARVRRHRSRKSTMEHEGGSRT